MSDTPQLLLAHHLKVLKLPAFLREYDKLAQQCAAEGVDHPRYLLRLAELELIEQERRIVERRIREARFPTVKSLDSFDFTAIPSINKTLVLELARGEYIARRENVIAVGNSGTGKTHKLGLPSCWHDHCGTTSPSACRNPRVVPGWAQTPSAASWFAPASLLEGIGFQPSVLVRGLAFFGNRSVQAFRRTVANPKSNQSRRVSRSRRLASGQEHIVRGGDQHLADPHQRCQVRFALSRRIIAGSAFTEPTAWNA
jgi:hypothetical protein